MNKETLTRPFPPELIRHRPGRNGAMLSYIATHAVIARLNEGCDRWDFEIVKHEIHGDDIVLLGKLTADGVLKMAFGGSSLTKDSKGRVISMADDLKAAASDSLKKCATLLGVGLELYGASPSYQQPKQEQAEELSRTPVPTDNPAAQPQESEGADQIRLAKPSSDQRNQITPRQVAAIHATCKRLGIAKEQLSSLIEEKTGKKEVELLTKSEASAFLDRFARAASAA